MEFLVAGLMSREVRGRLRAHVVGGLGEEHMLHDVSLARSRRPAASAVRSDSWARTMTVKPPETPPYMTPPSLFSRYARPISGYAATAPVIRVR